MNHRQRTDCYDLRGNQSFCCPLALKPAALAAARRPVCSQQRAGRRNQAVAGSRERSGSCERCGHRCTTRGGAQRIRQTHVRVCSRSSLLVVARPVRDAARKGLKTGGWVGNHTAVLSPPLPLGGEPCNWLPSSLKKEHVLFQETNHGRVWSQREVACDTHLVVLDCFLDDRFCLLSVAAARIFCGTLAFLPCKTQHEAAHSRKKRQQHGMSYMHTCTPVGCLSLFALCLCVCVHRLHRRGHRHGRAD